MSKEKKRSLWKWVGALAVGCGLCCLPLIVPLVGGTAVAAGVVGSWAAGWGEAALCAAALAAGVGLWWFLARKKKPAAEACRTDTGGDSPVPKVEVRPWKP